MLLKHALERVQVHTNQRNYCFGSFSLFACALEAAGSTVPF